MAVKKQPAPIDVAAVVGLSDMPLAELQSLLPICAEQQLNAAEKLAKRQAAGADLLAREQALQLEIDARWDGDTSALENELLTLMPRIGALPGMLERRQEYVDLLGDQARDIAKYVAQHRLAANNELQAEKQQAERDRRAAEKVAEAEQFRADKERQRQADKKTERARNNAAYYRPLR